jgi:hypothetical protein
MGFVVKISKDYTEATREAQFINPPDLRWVKELENVGSLSFTIPIYNNQVSSIVDWNKVELYEIGDENGDPIFSGVILTPEISLTNLIVNCSNEKRYLQKKIIFEEKSWVNVSVQNILIELKNESNARDGGIRGNLTYFTDVVDTVTKDFNKGTTYYEILTTIAKQLGVEWDVVKNEIRVLKTIGTDRSLAGSGDDFVELVYSSESPNENNISASRDKHYGNLMATSLIGKSGTTYYEKTKNTDEFGHLEATISFQDGDLSDQVNSYLDENSGIISNREISANTTRIDFRKLNVGDLVKIRIDVNNPQLDIDDSLKVLRTDVKFVNGETDVNISLANVSRVIENSSNAIAKLDQRLKAIELQ